MEPEQHLDVVMDTEAPQSCMTQARVSVVQITMKFDQGSSSRWESPTGGGYFQPDR